MSPEGAPYLLDTHTFLWMTSDPDRLGPDAREIIEAPASDLLLSVGSVWEMAIKASLGKLHLPAPLAAFLDEQLAATRTGLLDVRAEHAIRVQDLPWHHRDPFDRLLVAQARFEKLEVVSRDAAFDDYGVDRRW